MSSALTALHPHGGSGPPGRYLEGSEHCPGVIVCESVHERRPGPVSHGKELVLVGLQDFHTQTQHIQDLKERGHSFRRQARLAPRYLAIRSAF